MPAWSKGRVALLGDASACLTLLAGQGSHLAMADAYVLAQELERHGDDYGTAFEVYEKLLKSQTEKKQDTARSSAQYYVPSSGSFLPLRRLFQRIIFSRYGMKYTFFLLGLRSVLAKYP